MPMLLQQNNQNSSEAVFPTCTTDSPTVVSQEDRVEAKSISSDSQQLVVHRNKFDSAPWINFLISTAHVPVLCISVRLGMRIPIEGYALFKIAFLFLLPAVLFFLSYRFLSRFAVNRFDPPEKRMELSIQYFLTGVFAGLGSHWMDTVTNGSTDGYLYWISGVVIGGLAGASAMSVIVWLRRRKF